MRNPQVQLVAVEHFGLTFLIFYRRPEVFVEGPNAILRVKGQDLVWSHQTMTFEVPLQRRFVLRVL